MFFRSVPFTCLLVAVSFAQTAKLPLNHKDCDGWHIIAGQHLSADGEFLPYAMFPQEGDGEAVVRNPVIGKDTQFPAGERPQPAAASTEEGSAPDRMTKGVTYLERDETELRLLQGSGSTRA